MFTGIVQGVAVVDKLVWAKGLCRLTLALPEGTTEKVQLGASIAVDGVCLTVAEVKNALVSFDVIQETLARTTLDQLELGARVNVERSARVGDEIGGHQVSGHIHDTVEIIRIEQPLNNYILYFKTAESWLDYMMPKGYVALNGASLTIVDVDTSLGCFSVHLIPETLGRTTFSEKTVGNQVNLEIDQMTISVVNTLKRSMQQPTL